MKLTPESVLHEDTPVKQKKEKRVKKERKFGRKKQEVHTEDVMSEDAVSEEAVSEEAVSEEAAGMEDGPPVPDESVTETEAFDEEVPVKKPIKKGMLIGIVVAAVVGIGLCAVGVRGMMSVKSMKGADYKPAKTVNEEYQKVLDANEEGFDEANQKRLEEKAQKEDANVEETTGLETEKSKDEEIAVDAGAEERSKDEQIATLQAEIDSLKQQVTDAQNQATTLEQELNTTKAQLSASEARKDQLQSQLNEATASSVK